MRKRRQKPAIVSTPCTTRLAVGIFWHMPMPSAALTRAHRVWRVRTSRMSKRMGWSGGSANWRLRSGKRRKGRKRICPAYSYRATSRLYRKRPSRYPVQFLEPSQQAETSQLARGGLIPIPRASRRGGKAGARFSGGGAGVSPRGLLTDVHPQPNFLMCVRKSVKRLTDKDAR